MKKNIIILILALLFGRFKNNCFSQSNIIILVDSKAYYNDYDFYQNFSVTKKDLCYQLGLQLNRYAAPSNLFSLYAYTSDFDGVIELTRINALKKWKEFSLSLNDYRKYQNTDNSDYYSDAADFLKNFNSQIALKYKGISFSSTLFIVVGQVGEQFFSSGQSSGMLGFKKTNDFGSIDYSYFIQSETDEFNSLLNDYETEIVERDTTQPLRTYLLTKSINNIFTGNQAENYVSLQCDRKTMPGKDALQIFPMNNDPGELPINLNGQSKIKIQSCVISHITGVSNKADLLQPGQSVTFLSANNTMPNELTALVSAGDKLPLYNMLQPYLKLKSTDQFDSVYLGQMAVTYLILDDVYQHALFFDTINFKIHLQEPKSIYTGFQRNEILDNANLILYANKKFPDKEVTQDDITEVYKSQLQIGKIIAIILSILILFIFWFFIRKNKKITWQNLKTFYRK